MNGSIVSGFGQLGLWRKMRGGCPEEGWARGAGGGVGEVAKERTVTRTGEVEELGTGQTE